MCVRAVVRFNGGTIYSTYPFSCTIWVIFKHCGTLLRLPMGLHLQIPFFPLFPCKSVKESLTWQYPRVICTVPEVDLWWSTLSSELQDSRTTLLFTKCFYRQPQFDSLTSDQHQILHLRISQALGLLLLSHLCRCPEEFHLTPRPSSTRRGTSMYTLGWIELLFGRIVV